MEAEKTLELGALLKQLTNLEDEKIQATVSAVTSGEWALTTTLGEKEKQFVQQLLQKLATIDVEQMKGFVESGKPVELGFSIIDPWFGVNINPDTIDWEKLEKLDQRMLTRAAVLLCSYIFYDEFHYPQPQIGEYEIGDNNFEKLKWLYRYWFNQLEVAEKGSGLEMYFSEQQLDFELHNFQIEQTVSLSSAGDLLAVDVLTPENTPHLFDAIEDFYGSADIVCANLESPVDEEKHIGRTQATGQPAKMNTSEAMFEKFIQEGHINYFSTANNHSNDWEESGILATLDVLERSGAYHSGTNRSVQQQQDILIIEKNDIKIAMLSYTFDLNGRKLPEGKSYLVNEVRFNDQFCHIEMIEGHVARAREKGADLIIACCHWGWEFEMYPHVNIGEVARKICDHGVDVILGNHPHVSQPMEMYVSKNDKKHLIVYSHGDFVSYHPASRNSKIAYTIKLDIVKGQTSHGDVQTHITNLKMLPIYILNERLEGDRFDCRILKFYDVYNNPDDYGLTQLEREQLPHLHDKVLKQILLPQQHHGILVEE